MDQPSENVTFLKRCCACGRMHVRPGRYCSFECLVLLAEFTEFYSLRSLLRLSRWTGGRSQEQLRLEYYRQQLRDAIVRLPESTDLLAEVLVEILADVEGVSNE